MNAYYENWMAYRKGIRLANRIFTLSANFPKEERYSLTDQMRRSSRSVCANLAEGYAKRRYPRHFIAKLTDSLGEAAETKVWLQFAVECNYLPEDEYHRLRNLTDEVIRLLHYMIKTPERFGSFRHTLKF